MKEREAKDKIIKSIEASTFKWRTPRGISKETSVPLPQTVEILERSDAFVRSRKSNANGEPLYTTKEKYVNNTSIKQRIISVITNKI